MAYYDWNHDGKVDTKDTDIEYQMNEEFEKTHKYTLPSRGGISGVGVSVAIIGGLFLAIAFLASIGCVGESGMVVAIAWILCSIGLGIWFDSIGF